MRLFWLGKSKVDCMYLLGWGHADRPTPFFQNTKTENRMLTLYGRIGQNVYSTGTIHRRNCTHRCLEITSTMPRCSLVSSTMPRHIEKNETRNKNRSFDMKQKKWFIKTRRKNRSSHLGKKSFIPTTRHMYTVTSSTSSGQQGKPHQGIQHTTMTAPPPDPHHPARHARHHQTPHRPSPTPSTTPSQ